MTHPEKKYYARLPSYSLKSIQATFLEEIAYENGWISLTELQILATRASTSDYGLYLQALCKRALVEQLR